MRVLRHAVLAAAPLIAGLPAAHACQSATVIVSADATPAASLGPNVARVAPNVLELTPTANTVVARKILQEDTRSIGLCAEVEIKATPDPTDSGVGFIFWGGSTTQDEDYYFFEIYNDRYRVSHFLFGKLYPLITRGDSPALKKGLNQSNEIEARFTASGAEFFINGTKVTQIIARPSENAIYYGVYAEAPKSGPMTAQVKGLRLVR